jgi:hypothetical protein
MPGEASAASNVRACSGYLRMQPLEQAVFCEQPSVQSKYMVSPQRSGLYVWIGHPRSVRAAPSTVPRPRPRVASEVVANEVTSRFSSLSFWRPDAVDRATPRFGVNDVDV